MKEEFVTLKINGIDTEYVISKKGRVLTKNNMKEKCTQINHGGYEKVALQIDKKSKLISVHRAVYESFKGPIPKGMQVNHKDGNKLNNNLDNLELCTPLENVRHAWDNGLCKKQDRKGPKNPNYRGGEYNPTAKHTSEEAISVYALLKETKFTHNEIARMLNLDVAFVDHISKGLWADVTGFNKDEIRRNNKFTEEDELIIWYLYKIENYRTKDLLKLFDFDKNSINNKLTYLRRNRKDEMNEKIKDPKVKDMVDKFLGRDYDEPEEACYDDYEEKDDNIMNNCFSINTENDYYQEYEADDMFTIDISRMKDDDPYIRDEDDECMFTIDISRMR